jgi:ATP-dependent Clp endopeptidase proteolytic subunit ClpP
MAHRSWYKIKAAAKASEPDAVDVLIYDEISMWGVSAQDFVKDLQGVTAKTINLRINSPGGSVFDGTAIFNALKAHPAKVVAHIDGVAASIASIIALAGDEVRMSPNAFFMIHNPWGFSIGDAAEMRKMADVLDKIGGTLAKTYADKCGKPVSEVQDLMDSETWMTADEAKDAGFVDCIDGEDDEDEDLKAKFDLSGFRNAPKQDVGSGVEQPETETEDYAPDVRKMRMRLALMERGIRGQTA